MSPCTHRGPAQSEAKQLSFAAQCSRRKSSRYTTLHTVPTAHSQSKSRFKASARFSLSGGREYAGPRCAESRVTACAAGACATGADCPTHTAPPNPLRSRQITSNVRNGMPRCSKAARCAATVESEPLACMLIRITLSSAFGSGLDNASISGHPSLQTDTSCSAPSSVLRLLRAALWQTSCMYSPDGISRRSACTACF
jgi:hypothetical protein